MEIRQSSKTNGVLEGFGTKKKRIQTVTREIEKCKQTSQIIRSIRVSERGIESFPLCWGAVLARFFQGYQYANCP